MTTPPDVFAEFACCKPLRDAHLRVLAGTGLTVMHLASTAAGNVLPVALARVVFNEGAFEFEHYRDSGEAQNAFVMPVQNAMGEVADLCAFREDRCALWLNATDGLLGAEQAWEPRASHDEVDVWPDVWSWLRAGRDGMVVLDFARAFPLLRLASPLRVQSLHQGRALRFMLGQALPHIVVRDPAGMEHAA